LCRSGGLDANIEVVCKALSERCTTLVESLRERIPEAEFVVPEGGYFLWLSLGEDVDCAELLPVAREEGVVFVAGPDFMIEGGENSLRLSFAPVPADRAAEGVSRIAAALERLRAGSPA
ncbi:MAG TPA: aminotransferase class I/II-fold pyridoxal phosphate-dependent enzyme, partial [Solirubrobacterales bacterium]|nr:aminotransferase class I/II-fold pyridoxal phosphate-dependent enzyme [Solirubrobacterales bacterium]